MAINEATEHDHIGLSKESNHVTGTEFRQVAHYIHILLLTGWVSCNC
ncbi:hypothetical protein SAMN04515672_0118 [Natronorubrum texcoconense]|uniref:Uncharacterized protein n=1 Tax=Natronorubrum texcoconense TaxID=1095776 RepID=A0A1G9H6A1_9EURY|nr:hypothetical protein SAMN04515672_0118 [Natronorubrum texcoconense]